jgi:hypothetical protein
MPEPIVPDLRTAAEPPPVVTYTNWRGEMAERRIIPQRLWYGATDWHPTPGWLLDAFDVDRSAMRSFSLDGLAEDTSLTLASGSAPDPQGADEPLVLSDEDAELNAATLAQFSAPRAATGGVPDEPGDDDLTELREHVQRYRSFRSQEGDGNGPLLRWMESRDALALAAPGLLAEVERLRAAAGSQRRRRDATAVDRRHGHDGDLGLQTDLTDESWFDCPGGSLVIPVPPGTAVEVREARP